jgi:hypothetical protein
MPPLLSSKRPFTWHCWLHIKHTKCLWVQTLFCNTYDSICMSVNCSLGAKYLLHRSFCLCCHIFRLCHVKTLIGIPDGNIEHHVRPFL